MEWLTPWINPAALLAIATFLWRSQTRKFDLIDKRFEQVDKRFEQVDKRFDLIDKRFDLIDKRFEQVDKRFDRAEKQHQDLAREVIANGKNIALIQGRHEGHLHDQVTAV